MRVQSLSVRNGRRVCFTIRAVSARGRLAAWAREVQAAAPGWECSPRARHLCCTTYAVPVPASSARSGRPIPHRLYGIKHPLTNAGPSLKRTRTPSCTNHSDDRARAHWPTAPTGRWESTVETTDAGWADHPMISTEQCPRLSIERRKHHAVRQRGGFFAPTGFIRRRLPHHLRSFSLPLPALPLALPPPSLLPCPPA